MRLASIWHLWDDQTLDQVYDFSRSQNAMPRFLIRIRGSRLTTFLAMLRLVGYRPTIIRKKDEDNGAVDVLLEISGSVDGGAVVLAWLRTIPDIETVTLI